VENGIKLLSLKDNDRLLIGGGVEAVLFSGSSVPNININFMFHVIQSNYTVLGKGGRKTKKEKKKKKGDGEEINNQM